MDEEIILECTGIHDWIELGDGSVYCDACGVDLAEAATND